MRKPPKMRTLTLSNRQICIFNDWRRRSRPILGNEGKEKNSCLNKANCQIGLPALLTVIHLCILYLPACCNWSACSNVYVSFTCVLRIISMFRSLNTPNHQHIVALRMPLRLYSLAKLPGRIVTTRRSTVERAHARSRLRSRPLEGNG